MAGLEAIDELSLGFGSLDFLDAEEVPYGLKSAFGHDFKFTKEKSFFILGSSIEADFFIKNQDVAQRHLSFARDIHGVSVIPFLGQKTWVNGQEVTSPHLLNHQDSITVGQLQMIYYELLEENKKKVGPPKKGLLKVFDRIFIGAFLVVLIGLLWQMLKL